MYDVIVTDDTGIRFVKYTSLSRDQALTAKNEILHQVPRRLFNPRIRKTKCNVRVFIDDNPNIKQYLPR